MNLFSILAPVVYGLTSSPTSFVSAISTGTSIRSHSGDSTILNIDSISIDDLRGVQNESVGYKSCNSLKACRDCTSTYTCHWCEKSKSCHARGSFHGCTWGDSCSEDVNPQKNNTCASQTTCFDCTKFSRLCHWCEHDNACHAVGSRFGCTIGVDCYSNDQCRRSKPEPIPFPSSPIQVVFATLNRVPVIGIMLIVFLGIVLFGCMTCCFHSTSHFIGAQVGLVREFDNTRIAELDEFRDETLLSEEGNHPNGDCDITNDNRNHSTAQNANLCDGSQMEHLSENAQQCYEQFPANSEAQNVDHLQQQQQQTIEESGNQSSVRDGTRCNRSNQDQLHNSEHESGSLHHPSFNSTAIEVEGPRCAALFYTLYLMYYFSIVATVLTVGASLVFYPQIPDCNICNDEVAWTKIMKNIIEFKFNASFEILASLRNSNHISASLERGHGSFLFDRKQFGTFEIPPVTIDSMAITDFMIIIHVSPADKTQAIHLAKAYYDGNLVVGVNFEGEVCFPFLFGYSKDVDIRNIEVDVSAASDRSLCQCQKWDDNENDMTARLIDLVESRLSLL